MLAGVVRTHRTALGTAPLALAAATSTSTSGGDHRGLIIGGGLVGGLALGAAGGAILGPRLFPGGGAWTSRVSLALMGAAVLGLGGGLLGSMVAGPPRHPHDPGAGNDGSTGAGGRPSGAIIGVDADNPAPSIPPAASTARIPGTVTGVGETAVAPFQLKALASDLRSPVQVTHAPGDQALYVVEQGGTIKRITNDGKATTFLDITSSVRSGGERGLLSVAFHPDFARNGRLFVNFTGSNGETHVAELRAKDGKADASSLTDLLTIDQPYANHNGGQLQFGPDGNLYIGMGDGGSGGDPEGRAQNPDELLGKMLRIDVDHPSGGKRYGIPAGNPFAEGGGRPEIYATGVRNPWRFSFDRSTGDLWIGDVGQSAWEEVDFIPRGTGAGRNLGWDVREGGHSSEDKAAGPGTLTEPVLEYSHSEGASITGGYVYRGRKIPALQGYYVYGDYASNAIRALKVEDGKVTDRKSFDVGQGGIVSFGEGPDGELFATSMDGKLLALTALSGSAATTPARDTGAPTPVDRRSADVQYVDLGTQVGRMRFSQEVIHVKPGKVEIDFANNDGTPHNVVVRGDGVSARTKDYAMHGEAQRVEFTATAGETYEFLCEPHYSMGMKGTIVVDPA